MSPEDQLSGASRDLSFLDKLGVADDRGFPSLRFGHYIELAIENGGSIDKRRKMAEFLLDYVFIFGDHITHYLPHDANELFPLAGLDLPAYLEKVIHLEGEPDEGVGFDVSLYGFVPGSNIDDPTIYYANAAAFGEKNRLSSISVYLPAGWEVRNGAGNYVRMIQHWCNLTKPSYGTAGLAILLNPGRKSSDDRLLAFPLAKRFVGLDLPEPNRWYDMVSHRSSPRVVRAIRTINWLTVIDDGFVRELGGLDKIQAGLGELCKIHLYDGGIIIQAGERPELGDTNRGLIPPAYRQVARVLKPIRFDAYARRLIEAPDPLDSIEETRKWAARFD